MVRSVAICGMHGVTRGDDLPCYACDVEVDIARLRARVRQLEVLLKAKDEMLRDASSAWVNESERKMMVWKALCLTPAGLAKRLARMQGKEDALPGLR